MESLNAFSNFKRPFGVQMTPLPNYFYTEWKLPKREKNFKDFLNMILCLRFSMKISLKKSPGPFRSVAIFVDICSPCMAQIFSNVSRPFWKNPVLLLQFSLPVCGKPSLRSVNIGFYDHNGEEFKGFKGPTILVT